MEFTLSEEQQMLQDSSRKLLERYCPFDGRQPIIDQGSFCEKHWRMYADMGWLGLALPEQYGGLGGSVTDMAVLMEEFGRVLHVEPFWAVSILTAQTLLASGDDSKCQQLLPSMIVGDTLPVLAHNEEGADARIEHVATTARRNDEGAWCLTGEKSLVVAGNVADTFIVSARTAGSARDPDGITLFLVKPDATGLHKRDVRLVDNRWATHLTFDGVQVGDGQVVGALGGALEALEIAHDHGLIALCAESIGVMDKALWITRDYLKIRKQFGVALSSFQSLQHRMSEMLIELELSRSMVLRALSRFDQPLDVRRLALSSTKAHIGQSGKFICGQAIQLHGGIGVTEEYVIGHHFKRMTLIEQALGNSHVHLERLAQRERDSDDVCPTLSGDLSSQPENGLDLPIKLTHC